MLRYDDTNYLKVSGEEYLTQNQALDMKVHVMSGRKVSDTGLPSSICHPGWSGWMGAGKANDLWKKKGRKRERLGWLGERPKKWMN